MAKDKKGFMLYADQKSLFDKLPDDIAGKLIKHIYSYVNDEKPVTDDILLEIAFEPIKTALKRDLKKYESICERNKLNARKRWDSKHATASDRIPKDTKYADRDNDSDKDNDIKKEFLIFWSSYHSITKKKKTDKDPAFKYFKKLNKNEKSKSIDNIKSYYDSVNNKEYVKKAYTYLRDKNFNDEFTINNFKKKELPRIEGDYKSMMK